MIYEIKDYIKNVFCIDALALALFRICIALLLIFDLIVRSFALIAHYTDFGTLPLSFYFNNYLETSWISIHTLNGSPLFESILFIIAGIFAVCLLIGYQTKLATILSWFMLISLHSRNPTILQGGDIMLRVLVFWAMFIPLNLRYSLDAKFCKVKNCGKNILSFGTAGILFQVAFVYFFSALLKTGNEWIPNGTAIYYALQLDQFVTYFGKFLLGFPAIMIGLTYFTYFLELIGPILLFFPFYFKKVRLTATFAFIILLGGMALSLRLGHFPFVGLTAFILFLPSVFWDKLSNKRYLFKTKHAQINFINRDYKERYLKYILNFFAFFFIIYILFWNIQTLGNNAVPDKIEFVAQLLRIDQYWNMFSPFPLKDDGWYVAEGAFDNGVKIDLLREGQVVNYEKPGHVAALYKHERWRKYLMNLWDGGYSHHRSYYLNYLCYNWNKEHDEDIGHVKLIFMLEVTGPDYKIEPIKEVVLEEVDCNT
mgnify:FL=1